MKDLMTSLLIYRAAYWVASTHNYSMSQDLQQSTPYTELFAQP